MVRNPIERALGVWSGTNYRSVMLPGLGVVTCGELCDAIAALKAENERLEIAKREAIAGWKDAERALAERPRGVNEDALRALAQAYDREDSAQRGEPDPWNLDDPGDIGDSDTWVSERLACARVAAEAFLSALEPAAPEGRQEAVETRIAWEALECIVARADASKLSPIQYEAAEVAAKIARNALEARGEIFPVDFPSGLFPTRPAEQAVTDEMVEAAVQAIRQYTRETLLIDEHRELVRAALKEAAMEAGRHD